MRNAGKLFIYLSAGEFKLQKMVGMNWIPASLVFK